MLNKDVFLSQNKLNRSSLGYHFCAFCKKRNFVRGEREKLFFLVLVNYFNVWLKVRNTNFLLSYMDPNDKETRAIKDLVLNQVC